MRDQLVIISISFAIAAISITLISLIRRVNRINRVVAGHEFNFREIARLLKRLCEHTELNVRINEHEVGGER